MPRILLVGSHDAQLADLLARLGAAVTSKPLDSTAMSGLSRQPDAVVLDVRTQMELPPGVAAFRRQNPGVGVVIVARSLDPELLLSAMRAGVNEVVSEPLTARALEAAVARVTTPAAASDGQVFAFVGAKGGVGTTTVAVNVATTLGACCRPASTLLMDMHRSGGDAAVFVGVEPKFTLADAVENAARLDENFLRTLVTRVGPGVDLLAATDGVPTAPADASALRAVIASAAGIYRFVVLDVPRADAAALDALDAATAIVIVANQELATVRSAHRLAGRLRLRYGAGRLSAVVSRSDQQSPIAHDEVERAIGVQVVHMIPSDYRVAVQALTKGRPIALDNHNELSGSLKKFAYRLAGVQPEQKTERLPGLFGFLTNPRRA